MALSFVAACGGDPQVQLVLKSDDTLAFAPEFFRFVFPLEEGDPVEAGPFTTTSLPRNAFVAVPPLLSFSVDAIGCTSIVREECEEPGSFIARGCAGPFSRERDTELVIEVTMSSAVDGNARCPVAP
ncbi:MAG TPA: hypothetical protein VGF99_16740 [Myxococcota bacterium]